MSSSTAIRTYPQIRSISGLKKADKELNSSRMFGQGVMDMFGSRVDFEVYRTPGESANRGYFVTSELNFDGEERRWSVRSFEVTGFQISFNTVSEFRQYATSEEAHAAARSVAGI
jgi:hypothetical protein